VRPRCMLSRRGWLLALLAAPVGRAAGAADPASPAGRDDRRDGAGPLATVDRRRLLRFPADHGAHPAAHIEWWYLTGWLGPFEQPVAGFQITFFRSRTDLAEALPGRLAPRQLLFAHAALTDLAAGRHQHAQRIARWNGEPVGADEPAWPWADEQDLSIRLGDWSLVRDAGGAYRLHAGAPAGWRLDLQATPRQPLLMQGEAGFSRKGPLPVQASHYVSHPQLAVQGRWRAGSADAERTVDQGGAWLDHEWSDELLAPEAVGWDWAGLNFRDGAALTVFRLRRADGSVLWAGGSWRPAGGAPRVFAPHELAWTPGRVWASPATGARYPVDWTLDTPVGRFGLQTLLDAQELDGRLSTGSVYWEGLAELKGDDGRRLALGYLEMTGYVGRLRL